MQQTWFKKLTPKKLFLIDGLGAIVSAFCLGYLLVLLEAYIGMPPEILYGLAAMAVVYLVYDFSCYFLLTKNRKPYLKLIAYANLLHCILTVALLMYYFPKLKVLGWLYFIGEIIIVLSLVYVELKVADSEE